jgi:hypothetical protein
VEAVQCGSYIKDFAIIIEERQKYGQKQWWQYRNGVPAGCVNASKLPFWRISWEFSHQLQVGDWLCLKIALPITSNILSNLLVTNHRTIQRYTDLELTSLNNRWPRGASEWVDGRSRAGISGSNLVGDMDVCLLWWLCAVRYRSLWWVNHSSRGALPSVVCPFTVISKPRKDRNRIEAPQNK